MAERVTITCLCGRPLGTSTGGAGTKVCPSCKQKIRWEVRNGRLFVSPA